MSKFTGKSYDICAIGSQDNTSVANSAIGAAGAAASVTLAHDGVNILYLVGFHVTSGNPGATVNGQVTVTGLKGGTLTYLFTESSQNGGQLFVMFANPIPAVDANTDIVVSCPAIGSGGVVSVSAQFYKTAY